jgi:hypothetical protein
MVDPYDALRSEFPNDGGRSLPAAVADQLKPDEPVLWHGGPDRWGLFRATPFVIAVVLAIGVSVGMASGSGLTPGEYLWRLAGSLGADPRLVVSAAALVFLALLALSLRDPRGRWTYVVTDRRLLTFYDGRALRELSADRVDRLQVLRGIEGRLRNVGDVIWSRVASTDGNIRGPDNGRHGFRGMPDPQRWYERLQRWAEAIGQIAAEDALAFARETSKPGPQAASPRGHEPTGNSQRLQNREFGFALALPSRWVGRIGVEEKRPLEVLGMQLPIPTIDRVIDRPLHDPPEAWNFIEVRGRSGMRFTMNVRNERLSRSFDQEKRAAGQSLVDAEDALRLGPLQGFRVDYERANKVHVRRAFLESDGFHVQIIVALPLHQSAALLPMIDAVFDSIQPL